MKQSILNDSNFTYVSCKAVNVTIEKKCVD
jgi:hypothetical protein